jgi:LPLT family lysophospholipid transporter-like MFS transporter
MTTNQAADGQGRLLSKGMIAVMLAQFFSAFGDNALLFAILALIKDLSYPDWSKPVLQMAFVGTYILTAPFVGQIADSFPKGRVMMFSNGLKLIGALIICVGFDPFIGYVMVGLGAASYSPAKYGILSELTEGDKLVKANGLIEASTIAAILIGSLAGGFVADVSVIGSLMMCGAIYAAAVVANIYIPRLKPARTDAKWHFRSMLSNFAFSCKTLWQNKYARFTLLGTGLFWGAGVTLRFLLIDWVPVALGISDNKTPTILNAIVAVGIVIGAGLAAKMVSLDKVTRCIPAGILMGIVVSCFVLQDSLNVSYILLIVIGALGGFFLVPLNALLQDYGKKTVGAGNAIAVQNIGENSSMLVMLGLYSAVVALGVPTIWIGTGFGILFALSISCLWLWQRNHR